LLDILRIDTRIMWCLIHLLMILVLVYLHTSSSSIVDAFSTTTSSSSSRSTKPLQQIATTSAELLISIGRIQGTSMPEEWAASGAKLAFTLQVEFTDELANNEQQMLSGDALMGSTLLKLKPINKPTYVTSNGTQVIDVKDGVYGSIMQNVESKLCSLRFCLETSGAVRNDVELPSNEHIYFLSTCWLSSSSSSDSENTHTALGEASRIRKEITQEIDLTTARANKIKSQQLSSNIIGSTIQQLFNFRHLVVLSERKNKLQQELDEIEQMYPLDSTQTIQGPNDVLYAKEGAATRMKGTRLQYWYIGSFTINQFL